MCGWHGRAGVGSVMTILCIPHHIGRCILQYLIGYINIYEGIHYGHWELRECEVNDDTVQWKPKHFSKNDKSMPKGRFAWLEPSLQEVAGASGRVYFAFDVVSDAGLLDGVGACSSLRGHINNAASFGGKSNFLPITHHHLCSKRGFKSFGLCMPPFSPRIQGSPALYSAVLINPLPVPLLGQVTAGESVSFLVEFHEPDRLHATVQMFWNMMAPALFRYDSVDTSMPIYPCVTLSVSPGRPHSGGVKTCQLPIITKVMSRLPFPTFPALCDLLLLSRCRLSCLQAM
ncbi:hypothetical protein Pelo_16650 [Pelomyxa schiedti]|nr:hypothetical protein Pelo_16650 [Pelomyxa schiedti]